MHGTNPEAWQHSHDYLADSHERNERQTRLVIGLTAVMMLAEITAGSVFNSMALLADGWHMASHASALSITAFAYWFARRHRSSSRFSFGTGKVGVLGGFSVRSCSQSWHYSSLGSRGCDSLTRWRYPSTRR